MKNKKKSNLCEGSISIGISSYVLTRIITKETMFGNIDSNIIDSIGVLIAILCFLIIRIYKKKLTHYQYNFAFLCLLPLVFIILSCEVKTILQSYYVDMWKSIKEIYSILVVIILDILVIIVAIYDYVHRKKYSCN